jgi:hypothetical protein
VYADGVRASTLDKSKFEILKPKALAYDIDPAGDYMRPGNNPAEQAFQLLRCGLEMLLCMADTGFPTLDSRTRKRAPKYIRQALFFYGDGGAQIFGQAVPLLYAKLDGHLSGDEPPELTGDDHRKLYETVRSFYSFRKLRSLPEELLREYKVLEEHELPEEASDGEIPNNEYSQALLRGENPDQDPRLLALQRDHAKDFFIEKATTLAIKFSLSPNDRKLLKAKFVKYQRIEDEATAAEYRERIRNAWIEGSRTYLEYARLDASG